MFGSPILDVAIGMALVYLLLSLIASAFQEILASLVQARSANLERGIRSLFSGDSLKAGAGLFEAIYNHGLVRGLYQDPTTDYGNDPATGLKKPEPLWTRRRRQIFGALRLALRVVLRTQPPGKAMTADDLLLPAYIPSRTFALALSDILNEPRPFGWDSMKNIEANLTELRNKYKDNKAAEALLALVMDAAGKPEKLQANLENWYNDSMDRVSGWYRRYVQNILLFIGLGIAIAFNVDSIRVARTLWVDKDARAGLSSAASTYLKAHPNPPKKAQTNEQTSAGELNKVAAANQTSPTNSNKVAAVGQTSRTRSNEERASVNADSTPTPAVPPKPEAPAKSLDQAELQDQLKTTVSAFDTVSGDTLLPIGWRYSCTQYWEWLKDCKKSHFLIMLRTVAGWIVTAIALSLGAPFWFDALNKFMVIRSTVKPQEKSRTDQSKDN